MIKYKPRSLRVTIALAAIVAFTSILPTGCGSTRDEALIASKSKEYIQAPAVNDLYAADCSEFFADQNPKFPYCVMRISSMTNTSVTFIPADLINSNAFKTRLNTEYLGFSNVDWDIHSPITVKRAQLLELYTNGTVLQVIRPDEDDVKEYITDITRRPL